MRRILSVTTIALLPVLAYGLTSTVAGAQTAQPATSLQAKLSPLAAPMQPAAVQPAVAQPAVAMIAAMPHPVHSTVRINVEQLIPQETSGTLSFTWFADTTPPAQSTLPVLVRAPGVDVYHLDTPEAVSIQMTIDQNGVPSNLKLSHATGNKEVDQKIVAAISQYRFRAATVNHLAVASDVTVDVKLEK